MQAATVSIRVEGQVGWLVLSNPTKLNAISFTMWSELAEGVSKLAGDADVRVIALTGDGDRAFASGADISEFAQRRTEADARAEYERVAAEAASAMLAVDKPTVAVVKGICFGGGVGLAATCDMRLARDDAKFCVPAARLGLGYRYSAVERLVSIVGPAVAAEMLATARRYSAAEAASMRLVNHAVDAAQFDTFVTDFLSAIAANAPLTVAAATRSVREATKPPGARDLATVERMVEACFRSADYHEGRAAFAERRPPQFQGR